MNTKELLENATISAGHTPLAWAEAPKNALRRAGWWWAEIRASTADIQALGRRMVAHLPGVEYLAVPLPQGRMMLALGPLNKSD